ncbi:MAG: hypothetical protein IAG10_01640 [Planctomycetaceae bacterium]|nr:hypothetical protein [Planctomycetaceae bacterium]
MPISVKCSECGKGLKAPDAMAGKKAKCPQCGNVVPIPAAVVEAEIIDDEPPAKKPPVRKAASKPKARAVEEEEEDDYGDDFPETEESEDGRVPCPACGEMIIETAAKCRYCGEILNESAGRLAKGKSKGKRFSGKLTADDRKELKSFRSAMHWLGGLYIFGGTVAMIAGVVLLALGPQIPGMDATELGIGAVFVGVIGFTFGVFACLKHLWVVWAILVFQGLDVIFALIDIANNPKGIGGIVIRTVIVISLSRTALTKGKELWRRGIPLTTKP